MTTLTLKIGSRFTRQVATIAEASEQYSRERDASNEGASTFPNGTIFDGNTEIARVSYNGKVWHPTPWREGAKPVYNPYPPRA